MTLTFEYTLDTGAGLYPQVMHTSDNLLSFIWVRMAAFIALPIVTVAAVIVLIRKLRRLGGIRKYFSSFREKK